MGLLLGTDFLKRLRLNPVVCLVLIVLALWAEQQPAFESPLTTLAASVLCVLATYSAFVAIDRSPLAVRCPRTFQVIAFVGMNSMIIFLVHVICEAGFRALLIRLAIFETTPYIIGGVLAGLLGPLLLVPVAIKLASISLVLPKPFCLSA